MNVRLFSIQGNKYLEGFVLVTSISLVVSVSTANLLEGILDLVMKLIFRTYKL